MPPVNIWGCDNVSLAVMKGCVCPLVGRLTCGAVNAPLLANVPFCAMQCGACCGSCRRSNKPMQACINVFSVALLKSFTHLFVWQACCCLVMGSAMHPVRKTGDIRVANGSILWGANGPAGQGLHFVLKHCSKTHAALFWNDQPTISKIQWFKDSGDLEVHDCLN